ncbi:hypothetical protein [Halogeometricum sp. CBA1124]|uniref:hypothetical protein n=1 Tax=Halogeometricum sp. CBA1124 TaxID=2668071 RepID=UPI00142A2EA1|nr:hypothetical protein [Halogeometricum sp. CBA1124]MUV57719.1 hypothetical protein [Halogeometricum sp. CBA1124]
MDVVELDGEFFATQWWTVFGVGGSNVYLIDEVVERRGPVSLVAQVVDYPTSVPIGDELETRVETVNRHTA